MKKKKIPNIPLSRLPGQCTYWSIGYEGFSIVHPDLYGTKDSAETKVKPLLGLNYEEFHSSN